MNVCSKKSMPMCPPFLEKDTMPGSDFASRPTPPALVYLSDLDVSASRALQVCIGHCTTLVPAPSKPMMRHHTPFFMVCLARILTDGVAVVSPVRDKVDAILADLRACKDKGKLSSGEASSFSGRLGWLSSSTYGRIGRAGTRIRMIRAGGVVAFRTRRSESGGPRAHTLPERPWTEKST